MLVVCINLSTAQYISSPEFRYRQVSLDNIAHNLVLEGTMAQEVGPEAALPPDKSGPMHR